MGQRLNIEILSKDKCLANCYYHWSGYSEPALKLTKIIIENCLKPKETVDFAVSLLKLTGADNKDRNNGLIATSEEEMEEMRYLEEGRVSIHLDTMTFDFDVICEFKDCIDDYPNYCEMIKKSISLGVDSLNGIPFMKIDILLEKIIECQKEHKLFNVDKKYYIPIY